MQVVLIGAGRLATNLGRALVEAGHEVTAVFSRTLAAANALTCVTGGEPTDCLQSLPLEADAFIVSVADSALQDVVSQAAKGREQQLFLHTAGSMPMSLFDGLVARHGVFYPMQSFSKEVRVSFRDIPVFLEASDADSLQRAHQLAESLSDHVYDLSTADRQSLHVAAVFACNFVNHCYAMAADVLGRHGLGFDVMLPLVDETARKVHQLAPHDAQTGPAVRFDSNVVNSHLRYLAGTPDLAAIYDMLTQHIQKKHS